MTKPRLVLIVLAALLCAAVTTRAYERLQGPTELLMWEKDKAYRGYTLFGTRGRSYLLDMEGRVVHTWPIGTSPRLLENGNLLDASRDDPSGFGGFAELDWDGKVVWEYINPITPQGVLKVLPDSLPMTNALFRAYRYGEDHPALKGRALTPQGTITERATKGLDARPRRGPGDGGEPPGPRPRRDGGR